jgi:ATP-binding cassette, subfamily B (MDR/TAP), member 1
VTGNVFAYVADVSSAKGASSDVVQLLDPRPEIGAESTEGKKVVTENVHFRYSRRPGVRVLSGLTFEVQQGTYIALVGASGSQSIYQGY